MEHQLLHHLISKKDAYVFEVFRSINDNNAFLKTVEHLSVLVIFKLLNVSSNVGQDVLAVDKNENNHRYQIVKICKCKDYHILYCSF